MRNWTIIRKISLATCGIILLFLVPGGLLLMDFESNLVDTFETSQRARMQQSLADRQQDEEAFLQKNLVFNAQIFSEIAAQFLYNVDQEALKRPLRSFMSYPEILAITVLDEKGKPFVAAWKAAEITIDVTLPATFEIDQMLVSEADAVYEEAKVGQVRFYYTNTVITEKIARLHTATETDMQAFHGELRQRVNAAMRNQAIGSVLVIIAMVACLVVMLRVLVQQPLLAMGSIARRLAALDLTTEIRVDRHDEVGALLSAMREMAQSFKHVLSQVQHSGIQVTSSSTELAAMAKQQEVTVKSQVDEAAHVAGSVKEISDLSARLVEAMRHVVTSLGASVEFASSGQTDLTRMEEAMRQMEHASKSISGRLEAINEKAENITTVVTTINKVADQTNLLSLNAAIEAEKAGEFGRGFTVVAREIRRLADQTAVATLDIEHMVQEMQSAVSAGVMEMDKFIAEVRHSAEDVEKISMQLTRIIGQVQALSPQFEDVNRAIGDQSAHTQTIMQAINSLSDEMQQTRDALHETYAAIEQLNDAARGMQDEVSRFRVTA